MTGVGIAVFVLGLFVSGLVALATILVGIQEASNPAHSRVEDLTNFEKKVVGRGTVED